MASSGSTFSSCLAALIRNGLEHVWVLDTANDTRRLSEVDAEVEALRRRGLSVRLARAAIGPDDVLIGPTRIALMIDVADAVSFRDLMRVNRWALRESCPMMPAVLIGHQALIGPRLQLPACAVCALTGLVSSSCEPEEFVRFTDLVIASGGRLEPSPTGIRRLGRTLGGEAAFETFKALVGRVRPEIERGAVLLTARDETSVQAAFVPYTMHACTNECLELVSTLRTGRRSAGQMEPEQAPERAPAHSLRDGVRLHAPSVADDPPIVSHGAAATW